MVIKTKSRKTNVKRSVSKKQYKVVMSVKVGPFPSKVTAAATANQIAKKGVTVTDVTKTAKGYAFQTKVGYRCASATVQKQVIAKLRAYAKQSNLPASAYKITT